MNDETIIVGGFIATSFLTAENIQAGTLTGRTIQTDFDGFNITLAALRLRVLTNLFSKLAKSDVLVFSDIEAKLAPPEK